MENNKPKLRPCPFCGGPAEIGRVPNSNLYAVGCDNDFLCMGNINHMAMVFCTEETAATAWNRRAAPDRVKTGRNLGADTPSRFECSVCGWVDWDTYTADNDVYNYCPGCGAKMDGGVDGGN